MTYTLGADAMPRIHFDLSDSLAGRLQEKAGQARLSVAKYVALLVEKDVQDRWPPGYFEVFGGWQVAPLERPEQGEFEQRGRLD